MKRSTKSIFRRLGAAIAVGLLAMPVVASRALGDDEAARTDPPPQAESDDAEANDADEETKRKAAAEQAREEAAAQKEVDAKFPPGKLVPLFDGKSLEGWLVPDKFDFKRHGEVTIEKGSVEKGAMTLGEGRPMTGVSYQRPLPRIDYEVQLEARRIDGSDFFCGMTFPVGDDHLTLIVGGWGGGVTGISNLDGMSAVENETTGYAEIKSDHWYQVRLRVTKEKVEAWLDKDRIVDVKIAERKLSIWWEQEPMRPFGIATYQTKGALRNIRMMRLPAKEAGETPGKPPAESKDDASTRRRNLPTANSD